MVEYILEFDPKLKKRLKKLKKKDSTLVERFRRKTRELKKNPKKFRHLRHVKLWEMPLGSNYRVLYKIIDNIITVYVIYLDNHDNTEKFIKDYKE